MSEFKMREIKGHKIGLGVDFLVSQIKDRQKDILKKRYYAQAFVEIDAAIDEIMRRILDDTCAHLESCGLIREFTNLRILDGNKLSTILLKRKLIKSRFHEKIKKFKSKRATLIHNIYWEEKFLKENGEQPSKHTFKPEENSRVYFEERKKKTEKIVE
ncbi:MAG: hypothetical protein WC308_04550, partial [archaeon]